MGLEGMRERRWVDDGPLLVLMSGCVLAGWGRKNSAEFSSWVAFRLLPSHVTAPQTLALQKEVHS
jgi:hypothetical protein